MDLARAKVIAGVAQTIINSATVEVKFMNATGVKGTGFVPDALPDPTKPGLMTPAKVITHRLKG